MQDSSGKSNISNFVLEICSWYVTWKLKVAMYFMGREAGIITMKGKTHEMQKKVYSDNVWVLCFSPFLNVTALLSMTSVRLSGVLIINWFLLSLYSLEPVSVTIKKT